MERTAGRALVLISSSSEYVLQPIGELLNVDHVMATRMAVVDEKSIVSEQPGWLTGDRFTGGLLAAGLAALPLLA